MINLYRELTSNQYLASLATLANCINECPEEHWHAPVGNHAFDQVVFHTLFFTDAYLSTNLEAARRQDFHNEHASIFKGYEELEDHPPQKHYDRAFLLEYLDHCRTKAESIVASETEESLAVRPGYDWQTFSRAELHPYNVRHIQHHTAQLSLALRRDRNVAIDWVRSGWPEPSGNE